MKTGIQEARSRLLPSLLDPSLTLLSSSVLIEYLKNIITCSF